MSARNSVCFTLLTTLLALTVSAQAAVTNVAYWRFGENDPGAVNAAIATSTTNLVGGTMTLTNSPTYTNDVAATAVTRVGSTLGLRFNGANYGTNALVSTLTNNFGLELWVRPAVSNVNQCIAYNGNSSANGWGLYIHGGQFKGLLGGSILFPVTNAPAVTNVWTHLALVRDNGTNVFYVNGAPAFTNIAAPSLPTGSFAVAVQPQSLNTEFFTGALDELRVFSFASGGFSSKDLLINGGLVTTTADSGPGSLRAAVAAAQPGDTITFAPNLAGQTITLTSGTISLSTTVTIDASSLPGGIRINGDFNFQVSGGPVVLNSLTIISGAGIWIRSPSGILTLNQCSLSGATNQAILNDNTMSLNQCTISGNSGSVSIFNRSGTMTLNQCTLSGNSGGGILSDAPLAVNQSTVSGNSGSGIYNRSGTLTLSNSIVAGNSSGNIFGSFSGVSNLASGNPLLAPLGNYGGPTMTMPPLIGSPAVDAGLNSVTNTYATDQRGFPRLVGAAVDIGAVEGALDASAPVVTTLAATGVTLNSATLNATVNPRNFATFAWLEWGASTNYGSFSATNQLSANNTPTALNLSLTNLTPYTTYHFRAVATNAVGRTTGANQTLTPTTIAGDQNGDGFVTEAEINAAFANYLATSPWLSLTNVAGLGGTNVTFAVGNTPPLTFTVEYSTDLVNWFPLGPATPRYLFTDTNAPALPQRSYRLRYP